MALASRGDLSDFMKFVAKWEALVIAPEEVQELIESLSIGSVRSGSRLLARAGSFNWDKREADAVLAVAYDFRHNDDRAVGGRGVAAGSLQGHHDQGAKQPPLGCREVETGVADVLDGMGYGAATIPEIGDDRRCPVPVGSPLVPQ